MTQTKKSLPSLAEITRVADSSHAAAIQVAGAREQAKPTEDAGEADTTEAPQAWTEFDESTFRSLQQRRKLAGHKGRGADVAGQLLCVGAIKPNANTVASTIVGLLPATGSITRGELLSRMAATDFTSKSAKPDDRSWCQGYVAGVIRSGFVAVMSETSVKIAATAEAA